MNYLKALFDSELTYELGKSGEIIIADTIFHPCYILKELDPTAYETAFIEWCGQKSEEKLAKAEEILKLFSNRDRFRRLKEIYEKGAVTPFVGAGLSIPSGYPGWSCFLEKARQDTEIKKENLDGLLNNGQYEEAAELLSDELSEGGFLELVENSFGITRDIDGCVRKLPNVFSSAVITTNFDSVLEQVYKKSDLGSFDETLLASDAEELPRVLGEGDRALVKLHGKANSSKNRVLTKSEYDRHYDEEENLERVIEALSSRSLLFIGCSLNVDRTLAALRKIVRRKGVENSPKHYAFLKIKDTEDRFQRRRELAECNIHVIWYNGDHDECLDALLEKLVEGVDV